MACVVRSCAPKDLQDIMRLIKEIAVIYRVPLNEIRTSVEELKDAGFGKQPRFECFVAEVPPQQRSKEGHTLIGYVLSVYTYSTWRGRNLYMDNLYVMPEFRGRRIGKMLMERAAQAAWQQGCAQLRMHVSSEKPENLRFLGKNGGKDLTIEDGWNLFRFQETELRGMAAQSKP
ncbi:thialysine N-epsilon-acetyltransferase-like [Eublepharis macularius]|uniref:Thialysine N-epsilon-acetyltransferase-like n=1 Tax=Eublepharis macularius TaxID=481883 RepID=A0AA97K6W0_EUBMA|nr:thialysine N-epsilon-acetyltransferase-like [Eublepharis macularius]XP_054851197.1 thialysine N-epsilon-acetyltransferase-like [Eublepharis macularius]XP_054851198.1 thialysine N-epsilon-acetyltransferase-like [Eublepharis macularius]